MLDQRLLQSNIIGSPAICTSPKTGVDTIDDFTTGELLVQKIYTPLQYLVDLWTVGEGHIVTVSLAD
jgi:hypothetical protein